MFSLEINESPGTRGDILKGKHSAKKKKKADEMTAFYNKKGVATWVPANKSRGMVGKKKLIVRGKQIT